MSARAVKRSRYVAKKDKYPQAHHKAPPIAKKQNVPNDPDVVLILIVGQKDTLTLTVATNLSSLLHRSVKDEKVFESEFSCGITIPKTNEAGRSKNESIQLVDFQVGGLWLTTRCLKKNQQDRKGGSRHLIEEY